MVVVMLSLLEWPTGAAGARAISLRERDFMLATRCWACRRVAGCLATCCRIPFRFWW
jgi:hypothetical protein